MKELDKKRIVVVGAGISGLSCAYELQKKGFEVVVFEKESWVGGRMATRTKDNLPFDIGANHLCDLYDHMKEYCKELGLIFEPMYFLNYGAIKDGKLVPLSQAISFMMKLRMASQMIKASRKMNGMDFFNLNTVVDYDIGNAYDFMEKKLGTFATEYYVDSFVSAYQFHRAKEMSVGALLIGLKSIRDENKRWDLQHLIGGMSALPKTLAKKLNVKMNTEVIRVESCADGKVAITTDKEEVFDAAVVASTADITRKILKNPAPEQRRLLEEVHYAPTIGLAFKVPVELLDETSITWVSYKESKKLSGISNEMMKGPELVSEGKTLVCTWMHEEFASEMMGRSDEDVFAVVKKELLRICPWVLEESQLEPYDMQRWKSSMPKYEPGLLKKVKTFLENGQGIGNIFLCGDYLNSPWIEGSIRCGQRVADEVVERLS